MRTSDSLPDISLKRSLESLSSSESSEQTGGCGACRFDKNLPAHDLREVEPRPLALHDHSLPARGAAGEAIGARAASGKTGGLPVDVRAGA
eukprot:2320902-Pleurochrysis_carterae.AAC.1